MRKVKIKSIRPYVNFIGSRRARKCFTDAPILVGGCGRSGTSILLSILAAHPKIFVLPKETGAFSKWQPAEDPSKGDPAYLPSRIDRIHRYFVTHRIPKSVTRWCEKSPSNIRHIDKILDFFANNIFIIHIIRDGRDVMTSRHPNDARPYYITENRWLGEVKSGLAFADHPQVLTIKYEDMVLSHEQTVKKICGFIKEDYLEELKNWYEHTRVRKNYAWFHPLRNLHSQSIGKWKNPEHRQRIEQVMQNEEVVALLKQLNYED